MNYYNLNKNELATVKLISKKIDIHWMQMAARPVVARKMIKEFTEKKTINGQKV